MKKILVGMSGGVDSSVTALLLQEQGYAVGGVTLKLFDRQAGQSPGDAETEAAAAVQVAEMLGIPHFVLDHRELFFQTVIHPFAEGYAAGLTPNPCIFCNRHIKFGAMMNAARERGYDGIATGHYARITWTNTGAGQLRKGKDEKRDQSYVLYNLTQPLLARVLFPLGDLPKEEIRAMAKARGFGNADRPDSQDICFIEDSDYTAFLTGELGLDPGEGEFIDSEGRVLGRHPGILHYTIGQRKGLRQTFGKPMYVLDKDPVTRQVKLGDRPALFQKGMLAASVNFIAGAPPAGPIPVTAKTRYRQKEAPAILYPQPAGGVRLLFEEPQRAMTPGQSVVFYQGDQVLGGGVIVRTCSEDEFCEF